MEENIDIKTLNTIDDFKQLCTGLKTIEEFRNKYGIRVLSRFYTLKRYNKISKDESFPLPRASKKGKYQRKDYSSLSTLEDFNEYIKTKGYETPAEFSDAEPGVYQHLCKLGLSKDAIYPKRSREDISTIKTLEDLQKLVDNEKISSKTELGERHPGLRAKFYRKLDLITFQKALVESIDEAKFMKELIKYSIPFKYQFRFPGEDGKFRFDFLLDNRVIIEVHGRQHFIDDLAKSAWGKEESTIENDKAKKRVSEKNGIPIYYFTYKVQEYTKYGYFDKVYIDILNLLKELEFTTDNIDPEYEAKFSNIVSAEYNKQIALEEINKVIRSEGLYTREDIKHSHPELYWKMIKFDLRNDLDFCSWWTTEDLKNFLLKNEVSGNKTFNDRYKSIYKFFSKTGILTKELYTEINKNREDN